MKNSVNSLAIGMFVLGAALLSVVAVIVFGASKFFEDDQMFASRFDETVNGLDVGAPVKFKGVKIGKVERIAISHDRAVRDAKNDKESKVVVFYSVDLNLLKRRMRDADGYSNDDWIRNQIKEGLRSKLMYQSIVTGMLYVELDYFAPPEADIKIFETPRFIGIPSESSGLAELVKSMQDSITSIAKIDFRALFENANTLIVNLNKKVEEIDAKKLNASAADFLDNATALTRTADSTLKNADTKLADVSADLQRTLAHLDKILANVDSITSPDSQMRFELAVLIKSLNVSLNSITNLTEYLQRNPSALLTGKSTFKSKLK